MSQYFIGKILPAPTLDLVVSFLLLIFNCCSMFLYGITLMEYYQLAIGWLSNGILLYIAPEYLMTQPHRQRRIHFVYTFRRLHDSYHQFYQHCAVGTHNIGTIRIVTRSSPRSTPSRWISIILISKRLIWNLFTILITSLLGFSDK